MGGVGDVLLLFLEVSNVFILKFRNVSARETQILVGIDLFESVG